MARPDSTSHASLNGLYVKAQELDRGHAAPPPASAAPGASAGRPQSHASSHASTGANTVTGSASTHASNRAAHRDYSDTCSFLHGGASGMHEVRFHCFDTPNSIAVYAPSWSEQGAQDLLGQLWRLCLDLHSLWSFSLEGSDIWRINRKEGRTSVSDITAQLLEAMTAFHAAEPLFDFTIGRLSYLWKRAEHGPDERTVAKLLDFTGAHRVRVEGSTVVKDDPRVQVDVGGSAKGAAADLIAAKLREAGIRSARIDLGGNLYLLGAHPDNRPWHVDIAVPATIDTIPVEIEVEDASVVTSGSYERFVVIDGKRYQHIVDPRSGWPAQSDVVSATVVAESSLQADMLATTALLAGSHQLEALAARHPGCAFIELLEDGSVCRAGSSERMR